MQELAETYVFLLSLSASRFLDYIEIGSWTLSTAIRYEIGYDVFKLFTAGDKMNVETFAIMRRLAKT